MFRKFYERKFLNPLIPRKMLETRISFICHQQQPSAEMYPWLHGPTSPKSHVNRSLPYLFREVSQSYLRGYLWDVVVSKTPNKLNSKLFVCVCVCFSWYIYKHFIFIKMEQLQKKFIFLLLMLKIRYFARFLVKKPWNKLMFLLFK